MTPPRAPHLLLPIVLLTFAIAVLGSGRASGEPKAPAMRDVSIPTPRSTSLAASLHTPATSNGVAVVFAPGQGYHRGLPLVLRVSESLAAAGFTVVRFDWAYFTAKGQPAGDAAPEREDLEAALTYAKALPGVKRLLLVGKSLGSSIALARAGKRADDLAGLALLTFPLHAPGNVDAPSATAEVVTELPIPTLIVQGDADPLGTLTPLYALASRCKRAPTVVVVPGDHGFKGASKVEAETGENVEMAARAITLWARRRAAE